MKRNVLYAQSGGVTAVINTSAKGVIDTAKKSKKVGKILAGADGILGVLEERLIDVSAEDPKQITLLRHTPGGAFGSCRLKLPDPAKDAKPYQRLVEIFRVHNIGYFLYNGGNDSQDTTNKIATFAQEAGVEVTCVGVPKTVDNDLACTDCCPGFGSVAKYVATTVAETRRDVASMAATSTKLFILEVMGRHAGWIAAAGSLGSTAGGPVIIALPEVPHNPKRFIATVKQRIAKHGYCCVVASEGLCNLKGQLLAESSVKDSFGHAQLGGVAGILANEAKAALGVKFHWAQADYMQRAARHLASKTDLEQAYAVGQAAMRYALAGNGGVMAAIVREQDHPYRWHIAPVPLAEVANAERKLPRSFITKDGYYITPAGKRYLAPLIAGEEHPPFKDGLPVHAQLKHKLLKPQLKKYRAK